MEFWVRLAQLLPTGEAAPEIARLRASLAGQTGDECANTHVRLHDAYEKEAKRKLLLSMPFRLLAQEHLELAVMCAKFWPRPWAMLAVSQMEAEDSWRGLGNLSISIEKQRPWIAVQESPEWKEEERLELCRHLALGGTVRCQFGQFSAAGEWFDEAVEEFKKVDTKTRRAQRDLEDGIVLGKSACLVLEFRYADAKRFIDNALADDVFSAYASPAHSKLIASRDLLGELPVTTRGYALPPSSEELWSALMEEVERCRTPEAARDVRRNILSTIRTHDANRGVQELAEKVQVAMKQALSAHASAQPPPPAPAVQNTAAIDLSTVHDPELRRLLKASRDRLEEVEKTVKDRHETAHRAFEAIQRMGQRNIASVKDLAERVYRMPLRYRAEWLWWSAVRFIVQIVAVSYFLEKILLDDVLGKALKKQGELQFRTLSAAQIELIVLTAVLLMGFVAGHFAEKQIDRWALPKYKRLLSRIVLNRSNWLWSTYNTMLTLLAQTQQGVHELEKQIKANGAESPPA